MTPLCRTCGAPIVRGAYLPWTHAAGRRGRGHYAHPAPGTFVDPRRPATRPTQDRLVGAGASNRRLSPASLRSSDQPKKVGVELTCPTCGAIYTIPASIGARVTRDSDGAGSIGLRIRAEKVPHLCAARWHSTSSARRRESPVDQTTGRSPQPVGASAPEAMRPPSGLSTTG